MGSSSTVLGANGCACRWPKVGGNEVTRECGCSKGFRLLVSLHQMVNHRIRASGGESWRECFWETREGAEMPDQALGWEWDNCCSISNDTESVGMG